MLCDCFSGLGYLLLRKVQAAQCHIKAGFASKLTAFKGARSRFAHVEKFNLNFMFVVCISVLIFSIPNHPCSFMVHCYRFGIFLYLSKILLIGFPSI